MIKNFNETTKQLGELATVINAFKSEAVQLRIVELIFGSVAEVDTGRDEVVITRPRRSKTNKKDPGVKSASASEGKGRRRGSPNLGGAGALNLLTTEGFFKKRQTIGQIIEHCGASKARTFKPNEISGPLARFVRDGKLKRQKNAEGQYEYYVQ
jgi:hypothetical protein